MSPPSSETSNPTLKTDAMGRIERRPIHGWINLDKPIGPTSAQAVGRIRRLTGAARIGHAGTLDPLASGILPLALGEATKTVSYLMDRRKTYRFTVRWGEARATDDCEGPIVDISAARPSESDIRGVIPRFLGKIAQTPPAFSAIKVAGQRAYSLARAGETVTLPPRQVEVHRFEIVEIPDADHAVFEVESGKGTYIRALARDMALALGTFGHLSALRRLNVGRFSEENAIFVDFLSPPGDIPDLIVHVLPIETALDDIPALALTAGDAQRLRYGQSVDLITPHHRDWLACTMAEHRDPCIAVGLLDGHAVAMVRIERGAAQPVRVFNFEPQ